MKTVSKLKKINKDFISQYLKACGVEDTKRYIKPDAECFNNPWNYLDMNNAVSTMYFHINRKSKIGILIDSDCDGACSAALTVIFLKSVGVTDYVLFSHDGKQHGVHDKVEEIIQSKVDFIIVPDGGTNDAEDCKTIKEAGIDILILDHHLIEKENISAIVINPYRGSSELNTDISGTGVVYKFCEAYYHMYMGCEWEECGNTRDIVAVSLVSDVCNLSSLENRAFMHYGLSDPDNEFLNYLFEKKCKRRGINSDGIGWDIAPLANTLARSDEQDTKLLFFKALIGDIGFEDGVKEISRVKRNQDSLVKEEYERLSSEVDYNQKAIVGFSDPTNKSYLGLIANKFCGKYNKPTFILRELNSTTWSGSMRSNIDLANRINETGLAQAQGHEGACGIVIKKAYFDRFIEWLDTLEISHDPEIEVTADVAPNQLTVDFCEKISNNKILWGKGVPNPSFHIKHRVTKDNVFIFKKNTTTVKIQFGNLSCLMFFAKEEDVEAFTKHDVFDIELVVGECGINEYNGYITPQAIIQEYEIIPVKDGNADWSDLF